MEKETIDYQSERLPPGWKQESKNWFCKQEGPFTVYLHRQRRFWYIEKVLRGELVTTNQKYKSLKKAFAAADKKLEDLLQAGA